MIFNTYEGTVDPRFLPKSIFLSLGFIGNFPLFKTSLAAYDALGPVWASKKVGYITDSGGVWYNKQGVGWYRFGNICDHTSMSLEDYIKFMEASSVTQFAGPKTNVPKTNEDLSIRDVVTALRSEPAPPCKRCNMINEYAMANQPDGTYLCYGCRV